MDKLHHYTHYGASKMFKRKNSAMHGNTSGLYGDCTFLRGDVTGLIGDCTGLSGDCTGIIGDLDSIPRPQFKYKWFGNYVTEVEVDG